MTLPTCDKSIRDLRETAHVFLEYLWNVRGKVFPYTKEKDEWLTEQRPKYVHRQLSTEYVIRLLDNKRKESL